MTVKSAQSVTVEFTTANPLSLAASNADALPTGTLYVNGTANAATITVTNITAGVYKAAVTLPAVSAGDVVGMRISATVAGVAGEGIVWQETADTAHVSDTFARIGAPAGASLAADVATRMPSGTVTVGTNNDKTGYSGTATNMVAAAPTASQNATQVRTELSAEMARLDAAVSTRFATTGYAAPPSVAGLATEANATANRTTVTNAIDTRLATSGYAAPLAIAETSGAVTAALTAYGAQTATSGRGFTNEILTAVSGAAGADAVTLSLGSLGAGALVWVSSDLSGDEVIDSGTANDMGAVTFLLDAGLTYYRWAKKPGVHFTNPAAFVAVAD